MAVDMIQAVSEGTFDEVKEALSSYQQNRNDWSDPYILQLALKRKHIKIIKLLLNEGCKVQNLSETNFRNTPLYYAIEMQDIDIIRILLSGSLFNCIDYSCGKPIELILQLCPTEIIDAILGKFLDEKINPIDDAGFSPFHIACYIGNVDKAEKLIKLGNYVNCCISTDALLFPGFSPLHLAIESKCLDMVQFLLDNNSDIMLKNADKKSPFHLASEKKLASITDLLELELFKKNIHTIEDEGFSIMYDSLFVRYNEALYASSTYGSYDSWTPLHFAVAQQKSEMVKFILNHKVDINAPDKIGVTPLHLACQYSWKTFSKIVSEKEQLKLQINAIMLQLNKQIEITEMLLKHNADVNIKDMHNRSPLFHTVDYFKRLIPLKNVTLEDKIRMIIVEKCKILINLLLKYGADVRIHDREGFTLLHDISKTSFVFNESDKIEIAKILLSEGADINAGVQNGKTPLFLAIRNLLLDLAEFFIKHNAEINCICPTNQNFTPLHTLTYFVPYNIRSINFLNTLLMHGADVHAIEIDKATALHIAIYWHGFDPDIRSGEDEMAISLLENGAEVDARNKIGQTPLHQACINEYTNGTTVLLNYGADINIEDEFCNTPLCACSRLDRRNISFFYTIKQHVYKLQAIGFHVSTKNQMALKKLERLYAHRYQIQTIDNFLCQCKNEIERLKNTSVNQSTYLYDIIFKSPNYLVSYVKNEKFLKILESDNFKDEFELYGYLLKLQYKKGKSRKKLEESAEYSLRSLSNCNKIRDICPIILKYLTDNDLKNLISAENVII